MTEDETAMTLSKIGDNQVGTLHSSLPIITDYYQHNIVFWTWLILNVGNTTYISCNKYLQPLDE